MQRPSFGTVVLYSPGRCRAHFRYADSDGARTAELLPLKHTAWALAGAWAALSSVDAAPRSGALALESCQLESSNVRGSAEARCGWFETREDRDNPQSARLRIRVAVIPALKPAASPNPLFIVSGGPGQAASDFYLSARAQFEELRVERDLVVVDQRGTGDSRRLDCNIADELETARVDKQRLQEMARACLARLPGDPRFYSTSVAVRDLDEIRDALGYDVINLYGVSYGSRVVQHFLRRYPQRVRAAVLDGVAPITLALGPSIAVDAQAALVAILDRCKRQSDCRAAFPRLAEELAQLRKSLAARAMPIVIPDPRTAEATPIDFSSAHLAVALRLLSYSDISAALLPFLIHEAAQGRLQPLAAQALLTARSVKEQMAVGMQYAVVCTEDAPFMSEDAATAQAIEASYIGRAFVDALRAVCEVWPRGVLDANFHAPLRSDTPTLFLSGEDDPVTPARFGELASQDFSRGKHFVFKGRGHGQIATRCGARLIRHFIESASALELNTECLNEVVPTPFLLDANGPGP